MSALQPDEALYSLLCKYLLNEADELERRWVDTWRMESAANEEVLSSIQKMLQVPAVAVTYPGLDTDSSWERLRKGILKEETPVVEMPVKSRKLRIASIAAAAAVVIGLGIWFLSAPVQPEEFAGRQQAALEDGSHVNMEQNASMQLVAGFGKKERRVQFSGKGEFDIARNADAPFIVELGEVEIEVLGTKFTVDFQPGSKNLTVHVSNGRIRVTDKSSGKRIEMTEGMLYKHNEVAAHVKDIHTKALVFDDIPLREVLKTIEAVYDIQVSVADTSLLDKKISTNFTNAPVETIMSSLTFMTNTESAQTGPRSYTIQ